VLLAYLAALAVPALQPTATDGSQADAPLSPAVGQVVDGALEVLDPLADRLGSDAPLDWRGFSRTLEAGPEQALVAWAPRVAGMERAAYEADTGRDAFRSFLIREPGGGGLQPARARADHFPVHLVHPAPASKRLLGLDLLSDPGLAAAIGRVRRSTAAQVLFPASAGLAGPAPARESGSYNQKLPGGEPARVLVVVVVPVLRQGALAGVLVAALPAPAPVRPVAPRLVTLPRAR
jgi:hypothetical protein